MHTRHQNVAILELVLKTFTLRRKLSPHTHKQTPALYSVQAEAPPPHERERESHCTLVVFRRSSTTLSGDLITTDVDTRVKATQFATSCQDGKQTKQDAPLVWSKTCGKSRTFGLLSVRVCDERSYFY
eukprot:COSAG02_NODE_1852_length_10661_cov_3.072429_14_plen_128_part_00